MKQFLGAVRSATITDGKLYALCFHEKNRHMIKIFDLDLNPIKEFTLDNDAWYENLASYKGFLYVSGVNGSGKKWFVEKRKITDLSLVDKIEGGGAKRLSAWFYMALNPMTGQLWVKVSPLEDEGFIKIFDQELVQLKEIEDTDERLYGWGLDFDEEGNAYLGGLELVDGELEWVLYKFDSHWNRVHQRPLPLSAAAHDRPRIVEYANGHLYVIGSRWERRPKNVIYAFDKDLSLVDELNLSDEVIHGAISDDENLYIVGLDYRTWYIYSVSLINPMPKESRLKSSLLTVPLNTFAIDLSSIIPLRVASLEGLLYGYGPAGSKGFELSLPVGVVPRGFEGRWTCHLLGRGGWSSAYLLTRDGQRVVVKVPRGLEAVIEGGERPTIHEKLLERVKHEAEIVGSLDHPNILKLLGVSEKLALVIYEYAEFGSLYWQLARGWRPALRDVLLLGIQIGDAVRYVHSRGLIHGDIKPGNVLIKDRIAKLGDFSSMVRLLSSASFSKMAFTIGFRAPEQVYADLRKRARELGVENRIDVYQLGNVLLYTLTGESVDGEEAFNDKLALEKLRGVSNEDLRFLLAKALVLEPEKRPSAEEFTKMLYAMWLKVARS